MSDFYRECADRKRTMSIDERMRKGRDLTERKISEQYDKLVETRAIADPQERNRQADAIRTRIQAYEESNKVIAELLGG